MRIIAAVTGIILLLPCTSAWAGLDGTLSSLATDSSVMATEGQTVQPCPIPGIPGVSAVPLNDLCMETVFISYIHRSKAIEYMTIMPPEKVFAVYVERVSRPNVLMGPAYSAYKEFLSEKRAVGHSGRFVFYKRKYGVLAVDKTLAPKKQTTAGLTP